ncbi:NUDIX domain-containing protein [Rhodoferax saidenbachensis]|uniref:8-oxo-dGTP pyrophosphatase MutT (NUDIX family) n=1 Tax=Rhodoferax saidenbachensis TaxID=1484693 RepID=A0ABU1ZR66_9BURK|nr:NUDIX domain-containing protein [Rhodoferax saidenbachensis]MDR7308038.1 8-oxo-dGTP pyrophosphatase MutT (NUDIX family) [Rhodoferax saidenbachensis]
MTLTTTPSLHSGAAAFLAQLSAAERDVLTQHPCEQMPPADWTAWHTPLRPLGWLRTARAQQLLNQLAGCRWEHDHLVWDSDSWSSPQRSAALQGLLEHDHAQGLLPGWRGETFAFWHAGCDGPLLDREPFVTIERAGFRYLGLMSHAVHINGFTSDGRLWCGRRAANKATDPGLLDNVTAGGLPAGETVLGCALRELQEEAGLQMDATALADAGARRTTRPEKEGWHDEMLRVFNLTLAAHVVPRNQDGEVQDFLCLTPEAVVSRVQQGEFTADTIASLAQGLGLL